MAKKTTKKDTTIKKSDVKKVEKAIKKASKSKYFGVLVVIVIIMIAAFAIYCYFNPEIYNALFNKGGEPLREKDNQIKYYTSSHNCAEGSDIQDVKIHMVDVGQGDAIIIQLPDYSNVLIDAGPTKNHQALLDYANNLEINTFDVVLITHSDEDHVGGMDEIFENFEVKNVYRPFVLSNNDDYKFATGFNQGKKEHNTVSYAKVLTSIYNETYLEDNQNYYCNWEFFNADSGFSRDIVVGSEIYEYKFDFLTPTKNFEDITYSDLNDFSPYVLFTYGKKDAIAGSDRFDMLFTGDAEAEALEELLDAYSNDSLDVDVLKVGHHGSRTSTTTDFIDKIKPEDALISCGTGNSYKHPHKDVLDILIENQVKIWRTDLQEDIVVSVSELGSYSISYTATSFDSSKLFTGGDQ